MPRSARSATDAALASVMRADSVISSHTQSGSMPLSSMADATAPTRPWRAELAGREVHRHLDGGRRRRHRPAPPPGHVVERLLHDGRADRDDEARLLGEVDEVAGRDHARDRGGPSGPAPRSRRPARRPATRPAGTRRGTRCAAARDGGRCRCASRRTTDARAVASKRSTRLRPRSLARYIAASASCTRLSPLRPSRSAMAMPMLVLT